jgi:hypothetical protein
MRLASALGSLAIITTPALAAPSAYDVEFVSQFADACTTARTSFADNKVAVEAAGWVAVVEGTNPELGAIIGFSNQAAADIRANNGEFDSVVYEKSVDGAMRYLILSDALVSYGPRRENILGCYIYDFDAATPPDPAAVTALVGAEPTAYQVDEDVSSWQWNAPVKFAQVMDIYLTYVPEESQYKTQYGFSGLVLLLNTAIPSPVAIPGTEGAGS